MFGNNILPTSGPKEVDPITIANIQRQSQEREYEIVEDSIGNIKLKNYTSEDSALSNQPGLFQYYCSLCGFHVLVTDKNLAEVQRRRTDCALIIHRDIKFQRYMAQGRKIAVQRTLGYELQWRWNCKDCGIELAYQNDPHQTLFSNEITSNSPQNSPGTFYIIENALATDISYCELLEKAQCDSIPI
jgi:hypothetical protein